MTAASNESGPATSFKNIPISQPHLFDPPSGFKTVNDAGYPELLWQMVWINNGNAVATLASVTDNIASNITYVPGSLQCEARGISSTDSCIYDPSGRLITWQGDIGPDPGAATEAQAQNEVVITYRKTVPLDITSVENQGCANWDANNNGSLEEITQQNPVCTDDPATTPSGDPTVWRTNHPVAVPTINEWGMILFMLLAGLGSFYSLRKKSLKR